MRRREFIAVAAGAVIAAPRAVRAEESVPKGRLGVLMNLPGGDAEGQRRIDALLKALAGLGWSNGKNLDITYRWGVSGEAIKKNAAELVALAPDVILANAPPSVEALQQLTHTLPIVFAAVTDPVALGIVQSVARPGGNVSGFSPSEIDISGKWLELLKEISPTVKNVAVFRDLGNPGALQQIHVIAAAASSVGVALSYIDVRDRTAIDRDVGAFAAAGNGGLIVLRTSEDIAVRHEIITAAAHYRLPAIFPLRFCVTDGGLASYGPDIVEEYRQAAGYIDRILRGQKPGNLPVQQSTKFELVVNFKTAKALGLTFPPTLLATADEVIE
ncbi:MAG TPA: ABC transporter substrate-binding protein [Xanthobacteraceae bacterium]|jgi:putative ABC transport system substrate-binding protein|nr:ABC transporter substrate-binding protein [Xanthobacteraceae bacterium]